MFADSAVILLFCYLLSSTVCWRTNREESMTEDREGIVEEKGIMARGKSVVMVLGIRPDVRSQMLQKHIQKRGDIILQRTRNQLMMKHQARLIKRLL